MQAPNYEKQLAELEKKKNAITARQRQIKAKMGKEKRAKENHTKMVLGGSVFGVLKKHDLPEDRKQLELYGNAVKAVFQKHEGKLVELIEQEYQEQLRQAKQPQPAELPAYPD